MRQRTTLILCSGTYRITQSGFIKMNFFAHSWIAFLLFDRCAVIERRTPMPILQSHNHKRIYANSFCISLRVGFQRTRFSVALWIMEVRIRWFEIPVSSGFLITFGAADLPCLLHPPFGHFHFRHVPGSVSSRPMVHLRQNIFDCSAHTAWHLARGPSAAVCQP